MYEIQFLNFKTKCPILFDVKPIKIPDETIATLEADRFRTTYQIDYSHPGKCAIYIEEYIVKGITQYYTQLYTFISAELMMPHSITSLKKNVFSTATKRAMECDSSQIQDHLQFADKSLNSQFINQECYMPRFKITIETDPKPMRPAEPSRCLAQYRPCTKKFEYIGKCGKRNAKHNNNCVLPWRTEYRDNINKIGQTIMKAKLHQAKKSIVPIWSLCK